LVRVESEGYLKLRSADPTWHPEIEAAYLTQQADVDAMLAGYRTALEIVKTGPLNELIEGPWEPPTFEPTDEQLLETIARLGQTLYHPVATCAMGSGDDSVVDAELRVRGVKGLRIADASVMPRVPRGNTNAPTIMIGEKAADLIKGA
ncbi:MAG: choline dehydrogenase, partial [Actinomycetales bacterium]